MTRSYRWFFWRKFVFGAIKFYLSNLELFKTRHNSPTSPLVNRAKKVFSSGIFLEAYDLLLPNARNTAYNFYHKFSLLYAQILRFYTSYFQLKILSLNKLHKFGMESGKVGGGGIIGLCGRRVHCVFTQELIRSSVVTRASDWHWTKHYCASCVALVAIVKPDEKQVIGNRLQACTASAFVLGVHFWFDRCSSLAFRSVFRHILSRQVDP